MHCCWPQCTEEGTFPAPKNPRDLRQKQYFCSAHIKEFNKNWNGLTGFSENEIYQMQDGASTWQRPTWGVGVQQSVGGTQPSRPQPKARVTEQPFQSADDLYGFFTSRLARERHGETLPSLSRLPADVKAACAIFSIEQPLEAAVLKKRYLTLVKQHHPDVNKSADAPEHIKRINIAYRILNDYNDRRTKRFSQ